MFATSKDSRSSSPVIPTPEEIRAFLQQKTLEEDNRVRQWMSVDIFPILGDARNYTISEGVVSIERTFPCHYSEMNLDRVRPVVRAEIERKMPKFNLIRLEVVESGDSFFIRLKVTEDK